MTRPDRGREERSVKDANRDVAQISKTIKANRLIELFDRNTDNIRNKYLQEYC